MRLPLFIPTETYTVSSQSKTAKNNKQFLSLLDFAGFIFILNPFTPEAQWQWIEKCIKEYSCKPNICNLDAHVDRTSTDTIWNQSTSKER